MRNLSVSDVTVLLGSRQVVQNVSFSADVPSLIGLIGPNGAGKTSLLRAIAGLTACNGAVLVDALPVTDLDDQSRARIISYLAQDAQAHWPLEVERLVTLGRLPHLPPFAAPGGADRDAVVGALTRADVLHLRGRRIDQLSGGERARVLLARALAVEAPCLLVDEPVTSLDPYHQLHVMEVLRGYADEGALVIAVLHDLTLAARFCDRLLLLSSGVLKAEGSPAQVLTADNLADVYRIKALTGADAALGVSQHVVLPWSRIEGDA